MATFSSPPRGLVRALARAPIWLYRLHVGWLLDGRFLLLTHRGRTSGRKRKVVLEVVDHDSESDTYYVAAGWGQQAQWLQNVKADPNVSITVGRHHMGATAQTLTANAAERILRSYAEEHGIAMRVLGRIFGSSDPHELAGVLPIVALRIRD